MRMIPSTGKSAPNLLPSRCRLITYTILLSAAVAATNQALFYLIADHLWLRSLLYPWMALTMASLSWWLAQYLDAVWLRWLVFVWCLALLDILTIAACLNGPVPSQVGYALVSAQMGFVAVCAIMGPWAWQWRLPAIILAAAAVIAFSDTFMDSWTARGWKVLMSLVATVLIVICVVLRLLRYKLKLRRTDDYEDLSHSDVSISQFGLKHVLVWSTAMAPALLIVRGIDFFMMKTLGKGGAFAGALLAVCVAMITLVAIWGVLGGGKWFVRWMFVLSLPLVVAEILTVYSAYVEGRYGRWSGPDIVDAFIEMRSMWFGWVWLNTALLAAMLLFLRASGLRLDHVKPTA